MSVNKFDDEEKIKMFFLISYIYIYKRKLKKIYPMNDDMIILKFRELGDIYFSNEG